MPDRFYCVNEFQKLIEQLSLDSWSGQKSELLAISVFESIAKVAQENAEKQAAEAMQGSLF